MKQLVVKSVCQAAWFRVGDHQLRIYREQRAGSPEWLHRASGVNEPP